MKAAIVALAFGVCLFGCSKSESAARTTRVTLVQNSPTSFELVASEGQPPYCHVFTVGTRGGIRQHTSTEDGLSPECPAGATLGDAAIHVAANSGKTKVYVIFSDRPLEGGPIALQIQEFVDQKQPVMAVDLRAPGRVVVETLEFSTGG